MICETEGEQLKAAALADHEARRELYVLRGRRAMLAAMLAGDGVATADDVRAALELPPTVNPTCLGAVPLGLARRGIIRAIGYLPTRRAVGHARPLTRWVLTDRAAAVCWLDANQEPLPPALDARTVQTLLFGQNETGATLAAVAPVVEGLTS